MRQVGGLYIDGQWIDDTGEVLEVENPATQEIIAEVPNGSVAEAESAVLAARRAFDDGPWGRTSPAERAETLRQLLRALDAKRAELIDLAIDEAGATKVVATAFQVSPPFVTLADMADRILPRYQFERGQAPTFGAGIGQGVVRREAMGVATLITPFNYPFLVNMMKVIPALAAGCAVVLKPSPLTPLAALAVAEAADEARIPPGVLNVVTADLEGSRLLTSHPAVDMVSFTGSEPVGAEISKQAGASIKRVVLELGGKSANIITAGADLDRASAQAVTGFTRHSGQGCACQTRILVETTIHDELVDRIAQRLATLKIGDPRDEHTDIGPVISQAQRERIESFVEIGVDEGGTIAFGGGRPGHARGYFVEPTLFVDVKNSMTIAQEEIFGPVAAVIPFGDDDEAVAIANDSRYGLGGSVWASDPRRAYEIASRMRTGTVTLNGGGGGVNPHGPFGGYKRSGNGREFGIAGLEEYLETKTINWAAASGR
jgi:aldehyde dehydrogenase (NAD+)